MEEQELQEAVELLRALIKIDTTNPPGREGRVAAYLAGLFGSEGIPYEIVEAAPGRGMVVARLPAGRPQDGLLLSAHSDVVPADRLKWTHHPFSGALEDGFIWGRGAVDMKHMLAASAMVMVWAKRHKWPLKRDLVFAAVADEEEGCEKGSLWLVANRPDLIKARYCLTEVGGFTLHLHGHCLVPVGVATKGFAWIRVLARGEPGHGSLPHRASSTALLLRALGPFWDGIIQVRVCGASAAFITEVASCLPFPASLVLRGLTVETLVPKVLRAIKDPEQARYFQAITCDTVAVTKVRAGEKENVLPSEAEALLDVRILPGLRVSDILGLLRSKLGGQVEMEVLRSAEPTSTPWPTPLWEAIREGVRKTLPKARVVPYVVSGFTDAIAWSRAGIETYGFAPVLLPEGLKFSSLFHGNDERIPVEGYKWGVRTLAEVARRYCT